MQCLVKKRSQALPAARVGRGRKQGRIQPGDFLVVFHNGVSDVISLTGVCYVFSASD